MNHLLSRISYSELMKYQIMIDYIRCRHPITKSANCFNIRSGCMVKYTWSTGELLVYNHDSFKWTIASIQDIGDDLVDIDSLSLRMTKFMVRFISRTWLYGKLYITHTDIDERLSNDMNYRDELKAMIIRKTQHEVFDIIKNDMVIKITSY